MYNGVGIGQVAGKLHALKWEMGRRRLSQLWEQAGGRKAGELS